MSRGLRHAAACPPRVTRSVRHLNACTRQRPKVRSITSAVAANSGESGTLHAAGFWHWPEAREDPPLVLLDMGKGAFANTTDSSITTPTYSLNAGGFEGTGMQSKVSFPMGDGSGRFSVGETATWSITGEFDGPTRLHVNAFIDGWSVKLTTPVPEPESYAMALVALGVLGAFRRLRWSKT
jgi:hypothetical protein